jgi:hypothetical protein
VREQNDDSARGIIFLAYGFAAKFREAQFCSSDCSLEWLARFCAALYSGGFDFVRWCFLLTNKINGSSSRDANESQDAAWRRLVLPREVGAGILESAGELAVIIPETRSAPS